MAPPTEISLNLDDLPLTLVNPFLGMPKTMRPVERSTDLWSAPFSDWGTQSILGDSTYSPFEQYVPPPLTEEQHPHDSVAEKDEHLPSPHDSVAEKEECAVEGPSDEEYVPPPFEYVAEEEEHTVKDLSDGVYLPPPVEEQILCTGRVLNNPWSDALPNEPMPPLDDRTIHQNGPTSGNTTIASPATPTKKRGRPLINREPVRNLTLQQLEEITEHLMKELRAQQKSRKMPFADSVGEQMALIKRVYQTGNPDRDERAATVEMLTKNQKMLNQKKNFTKRLFVTATSLQRQVFDERTESMVDGTLSLLQILVCLYQLTNVRQYRQTTKGVMLQFFFWPGETLCPVEPSILVVGNQSRRTAKYISYFCGSSSPLAPHQQILSLDNIMGQFYSTPGRTKRPRGLRTTAGKDVPIIIRCPEKIKKNNLEVSTDSEENRDFYGNPKYFSASELNDMNFVPGIGNDDGFAEPPSHFAGPHPHFAEPPFINSLAFLRFAISPELKRIALNSGDISERRQLRSAKNAVHLVRVLEYSANRLRNSCLPRMHSLKVDDSHVRTIHVGENVNEFFRIFAEGFRAMYCKYATIDD